MRRLIFLQHLIRVLHIRKFQVSLYPQQLCWKGCCYPHNHNIVKGSVSCFLCCDKCLKREWEILAILDLIYYHLMLCRNVWKFSFFPMIQELCVGQSIKTTRGSSRDWWITKTYIHAKHIGFGISKFCKYCVRQVFLLNLTLSVTANFI